MLVWFLDTVRTHACIFVTRLGKAWQGRNARGACSGVRVGRVGGRGQRGRGGSSLSLSPRCEGVSHAAASPVQECFLTREKVVRVSLTTGSSPWPGIAGRAAFLCPQVRAPGPRAPGWGWPRPRGSLEAKGARPTADVGAAQRAGLLKPGQGGDFPPFCRCGTWGSERPSSLLELGAGRPLRASRAQAPVAPCSHGGSLRPHFS